MFAKWLAAFKTDNAAIKNILAETLANDKKFHTAIKEIKELVQAGDVYKAFAVYEQGIVQVSNEFFKEQMAIMKEVNKAKALYHRMADQAMIGNRKNEMETFGLLNQLVEMANQNMARAQNNASSQAKQARFFSLTGTLVGFALAILLGIFLTKSITRPLQKVIAGMTNGAEQVSTAAGQVSASSQSLAQNTMHQVTALEETTIFVEHMTSVMYQNAENANLANELANDTYLVVDKSQAAMQDLVEAIQRIARASEETTKINKTIDEISFQTNILALNAAVEAARAGEAGTSFGVVADEVRLLARRSADAAQHTSNLMENTLASIREGYDLVFKTAEAFNLVAKHTSRIKTLVGEITASSQEQTEGVIQINKAVKVIDNAVQRNAANAEESASASEELSGQARSMQDMVDNLVSLVGPNGTSEIDLQEPAPEITYPEKLIAYGIS